MKSILVTGSDGQLGRTIKEFHHQYAQFSFQFTSKADLDITDKESLVSFFGKGHFDYCINCAAYTNVEEAERNPQYAFEVNAFGAKNLAEICKLKGTILIQISTDYIFDGEKEGPYTTEDIANPINEYGKSKLIGEEFIRLEMPNHFIIRTSWLYSKKFGHNFYKTILKKAQRGEQLHVTDLQLGCPTDTENLTRFILDEIIMGTTEYGTYHFTDGKAMTWYDFAKQILAENGLTDKVKLIMDRNYCTLAKRPKNSVLV